MIIDSSALLTVVLREPERERYLNAMLNANPRRMSVANWFESSMVVDSRGNPTASSRFEEVVRLLQLELEPVSGAQAELARRAWQLFGKGNHRARLNYGDCFAYALAKETGEPLLFKGDDFSQTDIESALKD